MRKSIDVVSGRLVLFMLIALLDVDDVGQATWSYADFVYQINGKSTWLMVMSIISIKVPHKTAESLLLCSYAPPSFASIIVLNQGLKFHSYGCPNLIPVIGVRIFVQLKMWE